MDVHPPTEPVHSWRDALTHIAIMTVGLFIALMLEGFVEYVQHKHTVREARANIRQELEDNHKALQRDINSTDGEAARVKAGLATLRFMQTHPNAHGLSIEFQWSFSGLSDVAWRTARDTGALGHMPYSEVQTDAGLYRLQDVVSEQMASVATHQTDLLAPLYAQDEKFEKIPDAEYNDMLRETATTLLDLMTLKQLMTGLDQSYIEALKHS